MIETFVDIIGYEGLYQISNLGRVKSLPKYRNSTETGEIFLKPSKTQKGYLTVRLYKDTIAKDFPIHRLVASMFIENSRNKPEVNHKNGIKDDNISENLEWCTGSENVKHAFEIGLRIKQFGSAGNYHKLNEEKVLQIKTRYNNGGTAMRKLAKEYSVDYALIQRIIKGTAWPHVTLKTA